MSPPTTDISGAWRGVWRLASGQRIRYISAIGASCIANALQLCVPLVGMYAIDVLVEKEFSFANPFLLTVSDALAGERSVVSYLWLSAAAGVLLTGLCGAVLFIRDRLSAVASESLTRSIRESLFRRLHRVPLRFFDDSDTGDLVQRCSSDVETLRVFLHDDVHQMGQAILLVLVMTPVLLWRDAWLTALALSLTPLLLIGAFVFFRKIRHLFQLVDESEGSLTALMQQSLTGIRVIHGFNRYEYETERFGVHNRAFRDKYNRLNRVTAIYWGVSDFIVTIQIGIVLFVGAYFVTHGSLTIGELFLFLSLISIVVWRIRHLGRILTDMGKAIVAVTRIQHVLGQSEEPSGLWPDVERVEGRLALQDVSLSYDGVNLALDGLNIEIAPGETIGLVGPPGSGKTSFVRALLRLYPISSGRMSIDDFDINAVDPDWLRSQFGVVLQEPFLFSRTVEENLRVGNENASEDEIVNVVGDAALVREISSIRGGFHGVVGERGVTLSGGQRQRMAVARALLRNPSILVLDDAFSAIDSGTEQLILDAIQRRHHRRTTIVIAHRLSTVHSADRILVFERGQVVQQGSHKQLIEQSGRYRRLWELQSAPETSGQKKAGDVSYV